MAEQPPRKGLIARIEPKWKLESTAPNHIEALIDNLHDSTPAIRSQAIHELIEAGAHGVPALIAALRSADASVWALAAGILVNIGAPAIQPLVDVLRLKRESEAVQILVIEILGQIGDPGTIDPLIQTLESESSPLRTIAAVALTRMGAAAVRPLLTAANTPDSTLIRQYATPILERIGTPEAKDAVKAWRAIDDMLG